MNGGIKTMEIRLEQVRFHAFHGMLEAEKKVGNEFEADISVDYSLTSGSVNDDLGDSICYAALYDLVKEQMDRPSATLEHLVSRIGETIASRWEWVNKIDIKVTKTAPPIEGFSGRAAVRWRYTSGLDMQ